MHASGSTNVHIEAHADRERDGEVGMGGEEVEKAMGLVAELKDGGEEVTWEKLFLRAPVRVLLVEGDDSTRQIITALLRKCGYRVTAASDGFKAWEMLREKDHNIDLVLTEVELPKMSGLVLLTMMMDQDTCNHIPVIMMSSNDSVSIAFKCLIKGAADFLVKPIRKNELKNLWQHVWRKQKGENGAIQNKTVDLCNNHRSIKNSTDKRDDMDCREKESDAQSSCTRSDMEVESTCKLQNNMELNHFEKQSNGMSLFPNDDSNGVVVSLNSHIQAEGKTDCQRDESSTELFDLIEVINNNQPQPSFAEKKPSSMPSLELSLDRCPHDMTVRQKNDGPITLQHSNSSAFSPYSNNRTAAPKLSKPTNSQAQNNGSSNSSSMEPSPYHPHYNGLIPEPDATKFMDATPSHHPGTAFRCTPIRLIPFPVPVSDASFDSTGSNPFSQPAFYRQSPPLWRAAVPLPEALTENHHHPHPHQPGLHEEASLLKNRHGFQAHQQREEEEEAELQLDEQRHVSATATGDSASFCNDNRYNLNENEDNRHHGDEDGFHTFVVEIKRADKYYSSQREAALNKFRLKRKERCFEKKVRYLSRKKLAEQRPRVKGQFVRQV